MANEIFEKKVEYEKAEQCSPDKIMGIKSSKSFPGFVQAKVNHFIRFPSASYSGRDIEMMFRTMLEAYKKFHPITKSTINLNSWKGKDEISYIEKPDSFEIITHQRPDQDSEVKEIRRTIDKEHINNVIKAINRSKIKENEKIGKYIETKEIARNYCIVDDLKHNHKGHELFPEGLFEFGRFFSDRKLHTDLNLILRLLDNLLVINYRSGRIKILKNNFKFQLNLQ